MSPRKRAILEVLGIVSIPLAGIAAIDSVRNPDRISPWSLDVATVGMNADPLADATLQIAATNPVLAAALDRLGNVTPFGALIAVTTNMAMQFAENHGKLPDGFRNNPAVPIIPREEFAEQLRAEAEAQSAAANGNGH